MNGVDGDEQHPGDPPAEVGDELSGADLRRWRLHSQGLLGPPVSGPAAVVRRSGAVQAQDHVPALWSVARRCTGPGGRPPAQAEVGARYDEGAFLRLHVLRPTWHFVPPERHRALVALTGPRLAAALAARWRGLSLTDEVRARAAELLAAAVRQQGPLTRADAQTVLTGAGIDVEGQRLPHLLVSAELAGVLTSGPARAGGPTPAHTWALVDDRVPAGGVPDLPEVVRALVLDYVRSHAPATERDLAWWSGLPLGDVRAGLRAAWPELTTVVVRGRRYWYAGVPPLPAGDSDGPAVHLVPSFDEYLVGHTESRDVVDPHGFARHTPRALLGPSVLVDGALAGRWRRVLSPAGGGRVDVVVTPLVPLSARALRGLEDEAERYAAFVGRPLRLVLE
jgi:hypothetical protein